MTVGHLRERKAAALLDGLEAQRAVAVAAREYYAGRVLALVSGERAEEDVDRLALASAGIRSGNAEAPPLDAEEGVGG
jgi:hypothetical protein